VIISEFDRLMRGNWKNWGKPRIYSNRYRNIFFQSKENISCNLIWVSLRPTNDDSQKFPFDNSPAKSDMKEVAYLFEDRNASQSQCIGNESSFILRKTFTYDCYAYSTVSYHAKIEKYKVQN